jgi:Fic family protein
VRTTSCRGQAIAEAGQVQLTREELERLQRIVIGDARFVPLGLRQHDGFIGDHDRRNGEPIPVHISARPEDLPTLIEALVGFDQLALKGGLDPVVAAAGLAFGFVYVHPFVDGNRPTPLADSPCAGARKVQSAGSRVSG